MGRGGGITAEATPAGLRGTASTEPSPIERFRELQQEKINLHYLTTEEEVRDWVKKIQEMKPKVLAVDFETVSKNGRFGAANGALRLVQLAVDEPERGIEPTQIVIDCFHADPAPVAALFRDPEIEKQIHYMDFEQEWSQLHIGAKISNVYDTCLAFQTIQKKLGSMDPDQVSKALPGWEKHDNRLATLLKKYQGLEMPKENQVSDWGREDLDSSQVIYATMDVVTLPGLVREVKKIAEAVDASSDVADRTEWVAKKINQRVRGTRQAVEDDSSRLRRALTRAASVSELDQVWASRRQMTIYSTEAVALRNEYRQRRSELG
jgi:ribonuclease D